MTSPDARLLYAYLLSRVAPVGQIEYAGGGGGLAPAYWTRGPANGGWDVGGAMTGIAKGSRVVGEQRAALTSELVKSYEKGASIRELAEKTGRSYGFVHRLLSDAEVTLRARGGAPRKKSAE